MSAAPQHIAQQLRGGRYRRCRHREVRPGERVGTVGSWSEASVHLGLTGRLLEVVLAEPQAPGLYMAKVYEPGASEPLASGITAGEAGIYQDYRSGQLWTYEPVAPLVVAGWQPPRPPGKTRELETDDWEDAHDWLARRVDHDLWHARWWADHARLPDCTGQPPCADCQIACWRHAASELTSLAETLRQPPPQPAWSQAAAGHRYWLQAARAQP